MTGLPVTRIAREIDPQVRLVRETGILQWPRAHHRDHHGGVRSSRRSSIDATPWCSRTSGPPRPPRSCTTATRSITSGPKASSSKRVSPSLVRDSLGPQLSVFSYLRCRSELWVAQQFAQLKEFHAVFRSCNRAFHQDAADRLGQWCGTCDKCCFIDLILAPFMEAADSEEDLRRSGTPGRCPARGSLRDAAGARTRRPALRVRR